MDIAVPSRMEAAIIALCPCFQCTKGKTWGWSRENLKITVERLWPSVLAFHTQRISLPSKDPV